jgi:hypothetical protein
LLVVLWFLECAAAGFLLNHISPQLGFCFVCVDEPLAAKVWWLHW